MAVFHCPGQDKRFWKPTDIFEAPCPHCGMLIEFWKDEPRQKCRGCGDTVVNPKFDLGCAKWCQYAKECLGVAVSQESDASLCDKLMAEARAVFGEDDKHTAHALEVLGHAERILEVEEADPLVVKAAAILHDIGLPEAIRKHGLQAPEYQEVEGPPIARKILQKLGVDPGRTEHICRIVGCHHSAGDVRSVEFQIVWDADWLANLPAECRGRMREELQRFIGETFRTAGGHKLAIARLLAKPCAPDSRESGKN